MYRICIYENVPIVLPEDEFKSSRSAVALDGIKYPTQQKAWRAIKKMINQIIDRYLSEKEV